MWTEESKMLYVVIVEIGEYSDRCDWVGGVFDNKEAAQRMIVEKSAAARQQWHSYERWSAKQQAVRGRFPQPRCWGADPELMEAIWLECGPAPKGESGNQFYLVEVPLNQWGHFEFAGGD